MSVIVLWYFVAGEKASRSFWDRINTWRIRQNTAYLLANWLPDQVVFITNLNRKVSNLISLKVNYIAGVLICSSLSDVRRFFRPITLQIGSKWWIISRKLVLQPEDYLIISVSALVSACSHDCDLAFLYLSFVHTFDAEQRKCMSWDTRWKQCSWWIHHYSWR